MKKQEFRSLCGKLVKQLPDFQCQGWMLLSVPYKHMLRGYCVEDSSSDPSLFSVTSFTLPLFVPTQHLYFLFGDRLRNDVGCEIWWDKRSPDLPATLLSRLRACRMVPLDEMEELATLVALADRLPATQEVRKWEVIAYTMAIAGEKDQSIEALHRLQALLDPNLSWHQIIASRATLLEAKLDVSISEARVTLGAWRAESLCNLGIRPPCVPRENQ